MGKTLGVTFAVGAKTGPSVASVFGTVESRVKSLTTQMKGLQTVSARAAALATAQARLSSLKSQYSANPTKELRRELEAAQRAFTSAQKQAARYNVTVAESARVHARATAAISRTEAALKRNQQRQANQMKRGELRGQIFTTVAMAATVAAPTKLALDFEHDMAKVGALARANKEDLAALTAQARQLGRDTVFTASQAAEGMSFLAMAGFDTRDTMSAMPGLLQLAAAGATDLGRTSDIASNILSAFKIPASDMIQVSDTLAKTFTSSNTTLETLGETMKYVGPVASAVNMSLEDTAAAVGLLGNVGIQGSQAGTSLRAALLRLSAPPKQAAEALLELTGQGIEGLDELMNEVGDAQRTLKSLGVKTKDSAGNLRPLADILEELNVKMSEMGTGDKMEKIKKIFGTTASAAMVALMEQAGQTVDKYGREIVDADGKKTTAMRKYMSEINNSAGTGARIAKQMNDTTIGSLKVMRSAAEDTAIAFGNVLAPSIRSTAESMVPAFNRATALIEAYPGVAKAVVGAGIALIGLKVASIAGGFALTILSDGLLMVRGALSVVTFAVRALSASMFANPVGLVVLAVAALAAGLYYLYQNCEPAREAMNKIWEVMTAIGSFMLPGVVMALKTSWTIVTTIWKATIVYLIVVWESFKAAVAAAWSAIQTAAAWCCEMVQSIWSGLVEIFIGIWDEVKDPAIALFETIAEAAAWCVNFLRPVWEPVAGFFVGVWEGIKAPAVAVFDWINRKFDEIAEKFKWISDTWGKVSGWFGDDDKGISVQSAEAQVKAAAAPQIGGGALKAAAAVETVAGSKAVPTPVVPVAAPSFPGGQPKAEPVAVKLDQGSLAKFEMPAPQIQAPISQEINVTMHGIPDKEFAQRVIDAVKSNSGTFEAIIAKIVGNALANAKRVAYDG